jgi:HK97 family phage major capsid protein
MNWLQKLKDKHSGIVKQMQDMLAASPEGFSDEDQKKYDAFVVDADKTLKQIENTEVALKADADAQAMANRPAPVMERKTQAASIVLDAQGQQLSANQPKAVVIPAQVKRWGNSLKSFKGVVDGVPADVRAYKAGMWFLAVRGNQRAAKWCSEHGLPVNWFEDTQSEGVNTDGGYLVYDELDNAIIDLKVQYGVFRRNARLVGMTSETKSRSRRTGGLTAYFVGESQAGTKSKKTWDRVQLIAKKLMVLTKMTNELSEDAIISTADDLVQEIAYAFAYKEDISGFIGDGTSTYGGIIGVIQKLIRTACTGGVGTGAVTAGSGLYRYDTGNAWSNIALGDITAMMALCPSFSRLGAKHYCSPMFYNSVMVPLLVAAGGATVRDLENGPASEKFLGYPVEFVEAMPTTAATNTVPLVFGNLQQAADFGDRRQTTLATSDSAVIDGESTFEQDEVALRGTERFDANVHDVGSSSTTGPVVGLIAHTG